MTGSELITAERQRQIEVEGWTLAHDDEHDRGQISRAAGCYANFAVLQARHGSWPRDYIPSDWPWDADWWKPSNDPVRNLEKSGALIAAEIDRLQRRSTSIRHEQKEKEAA